MERCLTHWVEKTGKLKKHVILFLCGGVGEERFLKWGGVQANREVLSRIGYPDLGLLFWGRARGVLHRKRKKIFVGQRN